MRQVVQCMHSGLRGLPLLKTPSPSGDDVPLSPSCPIHPSHPTLNPKSSHSSCTLPTKGIMLMVPRINSSEPHRTWLSPPPTLSAPIQPYLYLLSAPLPPYNPTAHPLPHCSGCPGAAHWCCAERGSVHISGAQHGADKRSSTRRFLAENVSALLFQSSTVEGMNVETVRAEVHTQYEPTCKMTVCAALWIG